jgi:7-cyano-7-deazaguanine synthase
VTHLMIGALRTDGEHADGRLEFFQRLSNVMQMQEGEVTVSAPAISMTAVELALTSGIAKDVLAWAHSCHTGDFACGQCRGCVKHYETWKALGWDPH